MLKYNSCLNYKATSDMIVWLLRSTCKCCRFLIIVRPRWTMRRRKRWFALVALAISVASASKVAEPSSVIPSVSNLSTCATGSVNWITHTLPQQCLRTSWTSSNTIESAAESDQTWHSAPGTAAPANTPTPGGLILAASEENAHALGSRTSSITYSQDVSGSPSATGVQPSSTQSELQGNTANAEDTDTDSALQNANFLSFEEWKKQRLGDAGQSPEAIQNARSSLSQEGERHRPGAALDTLGEDSEIDLDFSGFGGSQQGPRKNGRASEAGDSYALGVEDQNKVSSGPSGARSKDAGRTCKERFNYASFDCAANVLKTNPKCKSSSSVLVENKDSYMLNECSMDNKFLIVELCEYIQIDTVVLANFEFFSSMFRTFRVSVSDKYPVKIDKWRELGTYEARNSREIQAFLIENPLIWAKYIRIEFLTHYGNEFYCPLSLLRVHGTTMMEDYRHQEELARGEADTLDDELELSNEVIAVPAASSHTSVPKSAISPVGKESTRATKSESDDPPNKVDEEDSVLFKEIDTHQSTNAQGSTSSLDLCSASDSLDLKLPTISTEAVQTPISRDTQTQPIQNTTGQAHSQDITSNKTAIPVDSNDSTVHATAPDSSTFTTTSVSGTPTVGNQSSSATSSLESAATVSASDSVVSASSLKETSTRSHLSTATSSSPFPTGITMNATTTSQNQNTSVPSYSQSASVPPTSTQPATQESFFKTLSKRLSLLEANATLSLQYIESQSQLLRDAFAAVEKRQVQKTASFLTSLNETVLKELAAARTDYDQLWQSTVLELAGQRDEGHRERELLNERVRLLAEELVGQKRLMAAQATLLLVVLVLVVFTKAAPGQAGEVTAGLGVGDIRILQGMQALMQRGRSGKRTNFKRPASNGTDDGDQGDSRSRSRWGWESPSLGSPSGTRPPTSHGMNETQEDAWDDLLAFVDENVRPRRPPRSTSYLKQKPLPPEPRSNHIRSQSEMDESEDGNDSSLVDTPLLRGNVDGHMDETAVTERQGPLGVAGRMPLARRSSAMRAAKSAPTTPRTEHSPILEASVEDDLANGGEASGASSAGESVGLGIEID